MPHRICPRCHADLHTEDNGELTYCSHCGAAQITLSEELREQFEQQQLTPQQTADGSAPTPYIDSVPEPIADPTAANWPHVFKLVAFAAVIFSAMLLLTALLPPLVLVVLLWIFGSPIILLGIYAAKNPHSRITSRFGARLGMMSGLSIGIVLMFAYMATTLLQRFVLHQGAALESQYTASMAQSQAMIARHVPTDPASIQQTMQMLAIPEFRAGYTLLGFALGVAIYAAYSAIAGAFSGLLRSRAAIR